jgi:hypothetical protein
MSGLVKVTVIGARNLAAMDSNGFSDPYVLLELSGGQRKKTKIVLKNLSPTWNECFSFRLPATPSPGAAPAVLQIQVWDWDRATTDDFLGCCSLDLRVCGSSKPGAPFVLALTPMPGKAAAQSYVKGDISIAVEMPDGGAGGAGAGTGAEKRAMIPGEVVAAMKQKLRACLDATNPELDLSACALPGLPKIVAEQFTFLRRLDLSSNKLAMLPDVSSLTALEDLDLTGNQIAELPAAFCAGSFATMKVLRLNGNALSALPHEIGRMAALEKLELDNNAIAELPKEIGRLWNLEELRLSGNALTTLPPSVGALRQLQVLDVSCCRIEALPEELTLASRLMDLNLGNNQLRQLPEGIGRLTRLITLNLQDNMIQDLPVTIGLCAGLGQIGYGINISRNPITDKEMMEKYDIGPDHLLDYLMKRLAMTGTTTSSLPQLPMPRDLGEGPPPPWVSKEEDAARQAEQQKAAALQQQAATMAQKLAALKTWGINAIKDMIRPRLAQLRNDVRTATTIAQLLDVSYRVKGLNVELEKGRQYAPFEVVPPREPAPDAPQIEVLRGLTMAALNLIDNGIRSIQTALGSPAISEMATVVVMVQAINAVKTSLE